MKYVNEGLTWRRVAGQEQAYPLLSREQVPAQDSLSTIE
jgi:hypothetical protein